MNIIDEGSFNTAALSKAGNDLVRESLTDGAAKTQPLAVEDYEVKYCQATKGGKMPDCRVHVTSTGGTSMAVRLCDKVDGDGTVVPVKDATEALEVARKFCKCARNKPVGVRQKCARKTVGPIHGVKEGQMEINDVIAESGYTDESSIRSSLLTRLEANEDELRYSSDPFSKKFARQRVRDAKDAIKLLNSGKAKLQR